MSTSVTGYFQRLAQRSGLTGERPAAPKSTGDSVNASVHENPIEVDEMREVSQPASPIKTAAQSETEKQKSNDSTFTHTASDVSSSGYSETAMASTETFFEQLPTDDVIPPFQEADDSDVDSPKPKVESIEVVHATVHSTDVTNAFVQPALNVTPVSEVHRQDASTPEQSIEQSIHRELSATTQPSFIRDPLRESLHEAVPKTFHEQILVEKVTEQIVDQSAAASKIKGHETSPPMMRVEVTAKPEQLEHAKAREDNAAHISIGQISIEVHTPAPVTGMQASTKSHSTPPPSRSHRPVRPTNLRRYYLRGM